MHANGLKLRKSANGAAVLFITLLGISCSEPTTPEMIDPPSAVTALLVTPTSAIVQWTASSNASRVRSYNVLRNGTRIGEVTGTTFTDDGLAESTQYRYAVSANGVSGIVSALSTDTPPASITTPDVTPPVVTSISPPNRSVDNSTTAPVRVTFSEPVNPTTISASNFVVSENQGSASLSGTRSYEAATNTMIFTPAAPYLSNKSYTVIVSPGVKDLAGNAMAGAATSCFTPIPGPAAEVPMTGFWSGNDSCVSVHIHLPIVQVGNTLSLGACTPTIYCISSAVSTAGRIALGGAACKPSTLGLPRICDVNAVSLDGTVSGLSVSFTVTFDNGVRLSFIGSIAATGTTNPGFTGTISGDTLAAEGINFDREDGEAP